ncbi:DUF350 domain-containing protein [Gordonia caeni]|uniref:DUF350 domain-containing protein n=1 Tax=Gordonia caeni TaxID=1007097 RepID=A0ABP7PNG2_9ACTN
MDSLTLLRENLADLTSYGLLSVGLLILGFVGLDLVTPGSLRDKIWREGNRSAVILAVAQALGLMLAVAAGIAASTAFELWRGVVNTAVYGIVTIALMMFSFVLIDLLTPGKLGSLLLDGEDTVEGRHNPAVWLNAVTFLAIGIFVSAALSL